MAIWWLKGEEAAIRDTIQHYTTYLRIAASSPLMPNGNDVILSGAKDLQITYRIYLTGSTRFSV